MVVGVDAGLTLLGVWAPVSSGRVGDAHGLLMVLGFVGTLVALERAVALGSPGGYAAPALLGVGALVLLVPGADRIVHLLLVAGAAGLCLVYVPLWRRQRDDAVLVSALGAVLALGGTVLVLGGADIPAALPWLAGFVVLTIAGERLELARLAMPPGAGASLVLLGLAITVGVAAATMWPRAGAAVLGLAVLLLAAWLATHDVARRTVRGEGLPRFAAACMLAGQAWLAVAGGIWLVAGHPADGAAYDALVHAVFLGFALSMIMAHAPSILPAVTRVPLPYRPTMWAPWLLLQVSLVLRLWGGDALGSDLAREVGGAGNAVALLLFFVVAAASTVRGAPAQRAAAPQPEVAR
ncbi:hypothetical protein GCM10011376_39610 [Nocardioides flavus (ex Wang et al. 2016)]|uniref:Uncharacterized protein n=1 Tax=Nocardioides flavus (ex Wang et al. 2016) TaxID=2058780 RepID=A0ABQ3HRQ8_9ACTN|nr:hypothetical protein [Nocardioides flavus (ex Wang et al. 2016)]GHE19351.1 hypothetical protein GCM10011376_39610 [Nocardioides flavus (ex Wang et al. 2016)]